MGLGIQGQVPDGVECTWLNEEEVRESSTPLQLDVFHALRELPQGGNHRTRPPGVPTRGKKETTSREEALRAVPMGTKVRREFADFRGQRKVSKGDVYDFSDPCWRVRYPDGDWEELDCQEIKGGKSWRQLQPKPVVQVAALAGKGKETGRSRIVES